MPRRRVVITGMGLVTPLGDTVDDFFRNLTEGKSGLGLTQAFASGTFTTRISAQVRNFALAKYLADAARHEACGLNTKFALAAAQLAVRQAGLESAPRHLLDNCGVYLGAGEGTQDFYQLIPLIARCGSADGAAMNSPQFSEAGRARFHPRSEAEQEMNTTTAHVARTFQLGGPNSSCLTACAASSQAVGESMDLIRRGECDLVLSGGAHTMIHPFGVSGFIRLTALSKRNEDPTQASCPFDARRDGFVMGEGAAMLVLEELEHAQRRNAPILAELTGYGTTADAYRMTDSHPEGRGAIACMRGALADAGLEPAAIDYINAHGTSTQVNDRVETVAIKAVFGPTTRVPVSSNKSMLGHLIAAAGAAELVASVETIRRGVIPPTINYKIPDPELDLDYVPNVARHKACRHVLSNSFGFGGQNVALIVSRFG